MGGCARPYVYTYITYACAPPHAGVGSRAEADARRPPTPHTRGTNLGQGNLRKGKARMKVKNKITGEEGRSNCFNPNAYAEIIVYFLDGDCSSEFVKDYDVYLENRGIWADMSGALREGLVIPDNYNIHFREPADEGERERGWY